MQIISLQFDKKIIIIFLDMKIYITEDDMCTTQKLNLARVHKWFEANNCRITENVDAADKILVMTCNGFSLLEERSYERIKKYKKIIKIR